MADQFHLPGGLQAKISDEEMDELVKLFRAGHVAVPARATPDERVRAGLAVALVASGYRREADVLREAAEAYAAQWRSAARLGQAVDLPPTQASFVAWLEVRATAHMDKRLSEVPMPEAESRPASMLRRVDFAIDDEGKPSDG